MASICVNQINSVNTNWNIIYIIIYMATYYIQTARLPQLNNANGCSEAWPMIRYSIDWSNASPGSSLVRIKLWQSYLSTPILHNPYSRHVGLLAGLVLQADILNKAQVVHV